MLEKIEELLVEVNSFQTQSKDEIEQFRIKFSGKKGILNDFFEKFKEVPNEQKKDFGQKIFFDLYLNGFKSSISKNYIAIF